MTTRELQAEASIFSRHFTDAEELARAVRDAGIEYVPLRAGCYDACLTTLQAGSLRIQRATDQAHVVRGALKPSRAGLLFSIRHPERPVINGRPLGIGDMLALAPGRELHGLCPAHVEWASLSFPAQIAERLFDLGRLRFAMSATAPDPVVAPDIATLLGRTAAELTNLAQALSEQGEKTMPVASLAEGLMELCIEAFCGAEEHAAPRRATRDAIRILNAAEEFLRANIGRPIYTDELCKALAVSPRKLHQAFVAASGMSPHNYLKRRRLMMVHQILKADGEGTLLVKSVALAHGFWHLGNFAHDYQDLFGQPPSKTLAQAAAAPNRH